jgi:CRP-like cAMP-binding protein
VRTLPARQDIAREGERPDACCVVVDGWVCRYKLLEDGRRQIFSLHVPGDTPDLQSLHLPVLDHSVCAITPTIAGMIPHESLRETIRAFPELAELLWRDTLVDAGIFREWMLGIGRRSSEEHVAHLICELYAKLHAIGQASSLQFTLPITQIDLADIIGVSDVHANRIVQALRRTGLIVWEGRQVEIKDWAGLKRFGGFDQTYLHLRA